MPCTTGPVKKNHQFTDISMLIPVPSTNKWRPSAAQSGISPREAIDNWKCTKNRNYGNASCTVWPSCCAESSSQITTNSLSSLLMHWNDLKYKAVWASESLQDFEVDNIMWLVMSKSALWHHVLQYLGEISVRPSLSFGLMHAQKLAALLSIIGCCCLWLTEATVA